MLEEIAMSQREIDRYSLLKQVMSKQITQVKAAQLLGISDRQVRNLLNAVIIEGSKGIVSKKRGKVSNRALNLKFKGQIMALVRERYPDFGPTLASEKLLEYHNLRISAETLRKWMIKEHLWVSRKQKPHIYPLRLRRECFGELIQIDGSHHHWFEDRGDKCVLIVFIDDATGKLTSLFFCPSECLAGYFTALQSHIIQYGRPLGLYSDRHAIFGGSDKIHHAQFIRALNELEIESILAQSPQAKGRVERVNQTLQDRLVKEMRLRNICSMEDANLYLPQFMEEFNKKFSKEPRGQVDTHRPLASDCDLERILTRCEIRTLSKDLSFSFHNRTYQILESNNINRLKNKKIEIRQKNDGTFKVFYEHKELKYILLEEYIEKEVLNAKEKLMWEPKNRYTPNRQHPWKGYSYNMSCKNKLRKEESMV